MFVDYEYYKENFKGSVLIEEEFNKFGSLACKYITKNTLSRITDETINKYPLSLIFDIKDCACKLAEFEYEINLVRLKVFDSLNSEGIIKSKSAGEVSISYDTSCLFNLYLNAKNVENERELILKQYLYPRYIRNITYNLLSKVINKYV